MKPYKRTMPGLANGMGAAGEHLGGFAAWQTAGLNHHKRTMLGLANGMAAAKVASESRWVVTANKQRRQVGKDRLWEC